MAVLVEIVLPQDNDLNTAKVSTGWTLAVMLQDGLSPFLPNVLMMACPHFLVFESNLSWERALKSLTTAT